MQRPPILTYYVAEPKKQDYYITADWHWQPEEPNNRLRKVLDKAKDEDAHVLVFGDIFDAIFPSDVRRSSRATLKQSQTDAAINDLMNAAEDFFAPYADTIDFMSYGNHEISVLKYNNFDPIQDLHSRLMRHRSEALQPILRGAYKGFLVLRFEAAQDKRGTVQSVDIRYDHGHGGNPEVSKGTISLERMYTEYVADLYVFGHIHKGLVDSSRTTTYLDKNRRLKRKPKYGVVIPCLKPDAEDPRQADDTRTALTRNWEEESFWTSQAAGYARLHCDFAHSQGLMTKQVWIERL